MSTDPPPQKEDEVRDLGLYVTDTETCTLLSWGAQEGDMGSALPSPTLAWKCVTGEKGRKSWEVGALPRNTGPEDCSGADESVDKTQPKLINSPLWCWRCLQGDHTAAQSTLETNWTRLIFRWFQINLRVFIVLMLFVVNFSWERATWKNFEKTRLEGMLVSLRVAVTHGWTSLVCPSSIRLQPVCSTHSCKRTSQNKWELCLNP